MLNNIDMNGNPIINLPSPSTVNSPARLIDVVSNPTISIPGQGTSGHVVPFLDGNNTWSGVDTFTVNPVFPTNSISNASIGTMAANTVKGSIAGGTPADLTKTQATTLINSFTSSLSGATPASGGGTSNFLRADGTWASPLLVATTITNSLGADVLLNNTTIYFDGPSIAQGNTGTWSVSVTVTFTDTTTAS